MNKLIFKSSNTAYKVDIISDKGKVEEMKHEWHLVFVLIKSSVFDSHRFYFLIWFEEYFVLSLLQNNLSVVMEIQK